jgi:hypothetical protein
MSWRKKIKLQGMSRGWRLFIVQFERTWRRGIRRALRSSDGDARKECSAAASERATDGNNATRKGRRTGAMQRSGSDGRRTAAERRRTSACRAQGRSGEDLRERTGDVHGAVRDGTGVCELGVLWSVHARG